MHMISSLINQDLWHAPMYMDGCVGSWVGRVAWDAVPVPQVYPGVGGLPPSTCSVSHVTRVLLRMHPGGI